MTRARSSVRPSSRADPAAPLPAVEPPSPDRPIVSSAHLVSEKSPELSEFEFGLIIAAHAFNRWLIRCMGAAGVKDMTPTDVLVDYTSAAMANHTAQLWYHFCPSSLNSCPRTVGSLMIPKATSTGCNNAGTLFGTDSFEALGDMALYLSVTAFQHIRHLEKR